MIKIKIIEENNILKIKEDYAPIVCKNTNYQIEFEFGKDWNSIANKTAVFVVENKKTAVDFTNNTVTIPAMPNAQSLQMFLISAEGEETNLISSTITLNLCPSTNTDNIPEFEPLSNYVSTVIANVNAIKNGNIVAKIAEFASNVSNKNLLINGDFKVNQRANSSYKGSMVYSVDRWVLGSAMSFMNYDNENKQIESIGVSEATSTGTPRIILRQFVEDWKKYIGKTLTLSMEYESFSEDISGSTMLSIFNGKNRTDIPLKSVGESGIITATRTISEDSTNLVAEIRITGSGKNATLRPIWIKLEEGSQATKFTARSYAEELTLCQRYYQVVKKESGLTSLNLAFARSATAVRILINLTQSLRCSPTIKNSSCVVYDIATNGVVNISDDSLTLTCLSNNQCVLNYVTSGLTKGTIYFISDTNGKARIELDAEIY